MATIKYLSNTEEKIDAEFLDEMTTSLKNSINSDLAFKFQFHEENQNLKINKLINEQKLIVSTLSLISTNHESTRKILQSQHELNKQFSESLQSLRKHVLAYQILTLILSVGVILLSFK